MSRIVAMLSMSAGNESVGEEWVETKTFEPGETLEAVMRWAATRKYASFADPFAGDGHYIAFNVRLSIDQQAATEALRKAGEI